MVLYEIRNEEGKTTRATGSYLKMYKSSDCDICCIGDEDPSSSQGDCVSKILLISYTGQSAADTSPTGEHASSPKDDAIRVSLKCMDECNSLQPKICCIVSYWLYGKPSSFC